MNPSWSFYKDSICGWVTWDGAFTEDECEWIIEYGKLVQSYNGTIGVEGKELDKTIRDSKVSWLVPAKEFEWVYDRLTAVVMDVNINNYRFDLFGFQEALQFTEYNEPGGHYGKHVDNMYKGPIRKLSVIVQLSDPSKYEGGDIEMHLADEPTIMDKKRGDVIIFPSSVLHAVTPVTKGTRHSLVGWITGKPFT